MSRMVSSAFNIPEDKITETIYSMIRDGRYDDVIRYMKNQLSSSPKSRAVTINIYMLGTFNIRLLLLSSTGLCISI